VLTARRVAPSRDWINPHLGYLKTSRARAKVRHWFRQQDREINVTAGRASLERELHRLGLSGSQLEEVAKKLNFNDVDSMMAALGGGDLQTGQVVNVLLSLTATDDDEPLSLPWHNRRAFPRNEPDDFRILGVGNLLTNAARCCRPVAQRRIVGYITRGRGSRYTVVTVPTFCASRMRIAIA